MVGMYMLKSAGKRNQLLVYVGQLFLVAKVWRHQHASPRPVKSIGQKRAPIRISSWQRVLVSESNRISVFGELRGHAFLGY